MFNYPNCFAVILSINHNLIPLVPFLNHNLAPLTAHGWANVAKLLSVKGFAGDVNLSWGLKMFKARAWPSLKWQKSHLQFDLSWWNTWKPLRYSIFPPEKETCDKLPFVLQLSGEIQEDLTYKLDARCELIETYKFASALSQIVFTYPKHAHNTFILGTNTRKIHGLPHFQWTPKWNIRTLQPMTNQTSYWLVQRDCHNGLDFKGPYEVGKWNSLSELINPRIYTCVPLFT